METERKDDFKVTRIHFQKASLKPKLLRTFSRKYHSRVSKAFLMSIFYVSIMKEQHLLLVNYWMYYCSQSICYNFSNDFKFEIGHRNLSILIIEISLGVVGSKAMVLELKSGRIQPVEKKTPKLLWKHHLWQYSKKKIGRKRRQHLRTWWAILVEEKNCISDFNVRRKHC